MTRSGWCSGPVGAVLLCAECRSLCCSCDCHRDQTCGACLAGVLSDEHQAACVMPLNALSGETA